MRVADSEPSEYHRLSRRQLVRRWGPAAVTATALAGAGVLLHDRPGRHHSALLADRRPAPPDWRVDREAAGRIAVAGGTGPGANLGRALDLLGGMAAFVRPAERVLIKPNCAWDRRPEQAANTDPELIGELVRRCLAAGAAQVVVADNSCHDPERAFHRSGIAAAATAAGARVVHQHSTGTVTFDLGGTTLGTWQVLQPFAAADRVINVPLVKHHSLAGLTIGMKNWIGALVGRRSSLHQRLPQATAELAAAFRPTLTVVDATRVLTAGGPTGGSLALVRAPDRIAVATDPVAADAWGASMMDLEPAALPHLQIATSLGLGTTDWRSLLAEG